MVLLRQSNTENNLCFRDSRLRDDTQDTLMVIRQSNMPETIFVPRFPVRDDTRRPTPDRRISISDHVAAAGNWQTQRATAADAATGIEF